MKESNKLIYNYDPNIVDDSQVISASKVEGMFPEIKTVDLRGNVVNTSSINPDINLETDKEFNKIEMLISFSSIYNQLPHQMEIMFTPSMGGSRYYRVEHIDKKLFSRMIMGITLIVRGKRNTRKERRIMRRACQKLNLKRVNKVVYGSWIYPRNYCVEGK